MASKSKSRNIPVHRRSKSSHNQPYKSITETYIKETINRPIHRNRSKDDSTIPEIYYLLDDDFYQFNSPPSKRREYPVYRIPSPARPVRTEIYHETIDYEEYSNIDRNDEINTPRYSIPSIPRHQSEIKNQIPKPPIVCNVIPPTPKKEKQEMKKSESGDISNGRNSSSSRTHLPMYEEYISKKNENQSIIDENHNSSIDHRRSKSPKFENQLNRNSDLEYSIFAPEKAPRGNLRHIDSDSSENDENPKRFVYSHNVYVDSKTGRPFTPGRNDIPNQDCGKLKINVYFKPPHPPVQSTYTLDEIQIEKAEENLFSQHSLPPKAPTVILNSDDEIVEQKRPMSTNFQPKSHFNYRPSSRSSILRKESEILTIPFRREENRESRTSLRSSSNSELKNIRTHLSTPSEKTIPIKFEKSSNNFDDLFPKMVSKKSETPTEFRKPSSIMENYPNKARSSSKESSRPHSSVREIVLSKSTSSEKTFSQNEQPFRHGNSSKMSHRQIPSYRGSPSFATGKTNPIEEIVHIKEKYERDETIRRFYPTTTTV